MAGKVRLDDLLVARKICADVDEARRYIMAGRVIVDEHRLEKAGILVASDVAVRLKGKSRASG